MNRVEEGGAMDSTILLLVGGTLLMLVASVTSMLPLRAPRLPKDN